MAAAKNIVYVPILNTNDSHYRYKMPKLIAKVEGSGNGIKTVIPNMADIAKALHRPPAYPIKFFGYEVGAQVRCDKPPFTVNGAHDADELQKMLYSFIEKFVLCTKCKNPETKLKVKKDKTIHQTCFACGHKTTIPDTIKFTKYIINHPPEEDPSYSQSSSSSSKQASSSTKTKEKSSKKKSGTHSPTSCDEKKSDEDDEFGEIDEEELVQIVNGLQAIQVQPSAVDDKRESLNLFNKFVSDRKVQLNDVSVQKELLNEGTRLGIREQATLVLAETLFTENMCEEIKTYNSLLMLFCENNKEAQKCLIGGFEKLINGALKEKLINKVQTILYTFYDSDIIEEDAFIEWYEAASDKYVSKDLVKLIHEKANPFIKWLKETPESDEDENQKQNDNKTSSSSNQVKTNNINNNNNNKKANQDDDDDDDFEIEYSHRVSGLVVEQAKKNNAAESDGDDINIDDI